MERDELEVAWLRVLESADDDEVHQEFIHACMRAQNIEFAVTKYREQSARGQRFAEKYLDQLGTILGFYNMVVRDDIPEADDFTTGRVRAFLMMAFAVLLILGAAKFISQEVETETIAKKLGLPQGKGLIHFNVDLDGE